MTLKQFLKPDWRKIVVLIILTIISSTVTYNELNCMTFGGGCTKSHGFPFAFYSIHYSVASPDAQPSYYLNYVSIIPNIIIWYLLSCFIVWIYDKFRKKKK